MLRHNISDIHIKSDSVPLLRIKGELIPAGEEKLSISVVNSIVDALLVEKEQQDIFRREKDIDFAYSVEGMARFRVNISLERNNPCVVLRVIPTTVKSFEDLNLPDDALRKLSQSERGLILIAGITGSGKTTTLNSMIDYVNNTMCVKIVTIEDPIEYSHSDKKSTILQREIGRDTRSFDTALKFALRQDPDIIVIGELRDFESMKAAILAAETGHLVMATIHTADATHTIDRIISAYPPHMQTGISAQLASVLKGIVAQRLVISKDSSCLYPICEILIGTSLIKNTIADRKLSELPKALEQGSFYGMRTFDQDLYRLTVEGKISSETALENATNVDDLSLRLKGIERTSS